MDEAFDRLFLEFPRVEGQLKGERYEGEGANAELPDRKTPSDGILLRGVFFAFNAGELIPEVVQGHAPTVIADLDRQFGRVLLLQELRRVKGNFNVVCA